MPDVKEHGHLFKAEMVLAILAGLKWMTRRAVTQHNSLIDGTGEGIRAHWKHLEWNRAWVDRGPSPAGNPGPYWKVPCHCLGDADDLKVVHRVYPRVQAGDSIYVKETWRFLGTDMLKLGRTHPRQIGVFDYKAGPDIPYKRRIERPCQDIEKYMVTVHGNKWRSPLHMPRWASRLVLPVTRVGAARVQEISEADCIAEGCPSEFLLGINWFRPLWKAINGKRDGLAWESNPCLWVYEWAPIK